MESPDATQIDLCQLHYCLPDELIPSKHAKTNSDIPLFQYLGFINPRHARACLSDIEKTFRATHSDHIKQLNGNKRGMLALSYMDKNFRRKQLKLRTRKYLVEQKEKAAPLKLRKSAKSAKTITANFPSPEFDFIKMIEPEFDKQENYLEECRTELEALGVDKGLLDDSAMEFLAGLWMGISAKVRGFDALEEEKKREFVFQAQLCWDLFGGDTYHNLTIKAPALADRFAVAKKIAALKLDKKKEFEAWLQVFNEGPEAIDNYQARVETANEKILSTKEATSSNWKSFFSELQALSNRALSEKPNKEILNSLDELMRTRRDIPDPVVSKPFPFTELRPLHDLACQLRQTMSSSSSGIVADTRFHDKIISYWQQRIVNSIESPEATREAIAELEEKRTAFQALEEKITGQVEDIAAFEESLLSLHAVDHSEFGIAKRMEHEDAIADLEEAIATSKSILARSKRQGHQSFVGSSVTLEELDKIDTPDWKSIAEFDFPDTWVSRLSPLAGLFIESPHAAVNPRKSVEPKDIEPDTAALYPSTEIGTGEEECASVSLEGAADTDLSESDVEKVSEDNVAANQVDEAPPPPVSDEGEHKEISAAQPVVQDDSDATARASAVAGLQGKELAEILSQGWESRGVLEAERVNQLALLLVVKGELNSAYQTLHCAEQSEVTMGEVLPSELFKAAVYGTHVWSAKSKSLPYLQELFSSTLSGDRIEKWEADLRPFGRVVPALAFAASFQPALWTGNFSNAPQLLNHIKGLLDSSVAEFIEECNKQFNQGHRFSLETLSDQTIVKKRLNALTSNLKQWRQRIETLDKGYAPAIKAMKKAIKDGELSEIVSIILSANVAQSDKVQSFHQEYNTHAKQTEMVREMIEAVHPGSSDGLQGHALSQMMRMIEELVGFASDWLFESAVEDDSHQMSDLARRRFLTQLDGVIDKIGSFDQADLPLAATVSIIKNTFTQLKVAVDDPASFQNGDRQLPIDLAWPIDRDKRITPNARPVETILFLCEALDNQSTPLTSCEQAISNQLWPAARVMLDRAAQSTDTAELEERWRVTRNAAHEELVALISSTTSQLYNAHLCSILPDTKYYEIKSEIESIEDLIRKPDDYREYKRLYADVSASAREIDDIMAVKMQLFQSELDVLNDQDEKNTPSVISQEWREQVDRAFEAKNIAIIEEMLDQAKEALKSHQPIPPLSNDEGRLLSDFRRKEESIANYLIDNTAKQVKHALTNDEIYQSEKTGSKEFAKIVYNMLLDAEQHKKPLKKLDQTFYNKLKKVFDFLGVQFKEQAFKSHFDVDFNYKQSNQFSFLRIPIIKIEAGRPFPDFGEHQKTSIPIILAWDQWSTEDVTDARGYFSEDLANAFFISLVPVSPEQRDRYSRWCKRDNITMQLVDPVLIAYIGMTSLISQSKLIQNTLKLTMPFTFSNPYREDMKPAPLEMRYGREREFQALSRLSGGAAFITGGRQMGKSTILHEVQKRFHHPDQNQYAFLLHFDKYNVNALDHNRIKTYLWEWMYQKCLESGLLEELNPTSHEDKQKAYGDALLKMFSDNKDIRVMFLLDEMDRALEADARSDFELFRGLRALVDHSSQRCKIAVAGLQNVKRFESMPNHPLYQLGSSLVVGIMNTQDALQLIKEPMAALGYQFADELAPMRIIALTNRHPGLIQVFCKHLVDSLAKQSAEVGSYRISSDYVEQLYGNTADIREQVVNRFEITLNLDTAYLIIIYSLLLNELGAAPFLASEAKKHAEEWKPEFSGMSETQFSAYLDELVGLGVLRQEANSSREYQLRNTNIRNLLGLNDQRIEDNLIKAVEKEENSDPLNDHRMLLPNNQFRHPSPLSYRDEKMIVGLNSRKEENALVRNEDISVVKKFQVSIVQGSRALGIDDLSDAIAPIKDIEGHDGTDERYTIKLLKDSDETSIKQFLSGIQVGIKSHSVAGVIPVARFQTIPEMADLLDTLLRLRPEFETGNNPVRFVFVMDPSSLWAWMENETIAESQSETPDINILRLQKWTKSALSRLLTQLGMDDSSKSEELLFGYSKGWHVSLQKLSEEIEKGDGSSVKQLAGYQKITDLDVKTSKAFLADTLAFGKLSWIEPLLENLIDLESEPLAKQDLVEWLSLYIEENSSLYELKGREDILLNWLIVLQAVVLETRQSGGVQKYCLDPAIAAAWRKVSG